MYSDLPQFTRCCFCAPLRIGLLAWGYIKIILSALLWIFIVDGIIQTIRHQYGLPPGLIITIILEVIDITFSVILIIAAHRKEERLFYAYYIYSIVFFVIVALGCGLQLLTLVLGVIAFPHPYLIGLVVMCFVAAVSLLSILATMDKDKEQELREGIRQAWKLIQVYIVLLVRSELFKLRDLSNMQFTNQAGEAQCNAYVEKA